MSVKLFFGGLAFAGGTWAALSSVHAQGPGTPPGDAQGFASAGVNVQITVPPPGNTQTARAAELLEVVAIQSDVRAQPQTVCAMKLWRVDPSIDPGIQIPLSDSAANAKIRRIPATWCVAEAARHYSVETITGHRKVVTLPRVTINPDR